MRKLVKNDLENILAGATFLGSGGGGEVAAGKTMIDIIMEVTGNDGVQMVEAPYDQVKDDDHLIVVADVGAADTVLPNQSIATNNAFLKLNSLTKERVGKGASFIQVIEIGAENTLAPMTVAARNKMAVIDGDGSGRAVPEMQLCTFANAVKKTEAAIANPGSDIVVIETSDAKQLDEIMRPILDTATFGNSAGLATWQMTGKEMKQFVVRNSISLAEEVGRHLRESHDQKTSPIEALNKVKDLEYTVLGSGKLQLVGSQVDSGAFNSGTTLIINEELDETLTVFNLNENMIAYSSNKTAPVAMAPDSICYLSADGVGFSNAESNLYINKEVFLIGIKARAVL